MWTSVAQVKTEIESTASGRWARQQDLCVFFWCFGSILDEMYDADVMQIYTNSMCISKLYHTFNLHLMYSNITTNVLQFWAQVEKTDVLAIDQGVTSSTTRFLHLAMPPWCVERMEGPSKIEEVPRFARLVTFFLLLVTLTWTYFSKTQLYMLINSWFFDASGSSWKRFFHTVDPLMGFTKTSREGFNKIRMGHSLELVGSE